MASNKYMVTIGHTVEGNKPVKLDLLTLSDTRMVEFANSGGGKSWQLRRLIEVANGKMQFVILDPEGEFSTLREKLDILIVGGEGADVAADVRSAGKLARRIAELQVSAVIDLYDLKPRDRETYVKLFLEALLSAPKRDWHPMLVYLDEAKNFCPEKGEGDAESSEAVINFMAQGRKRGYAGILATQNIAGLNKQAIRNANNVIIGRAWLDLDQKRAGKMLQLDAEGTQGLRKLKPGEFYAFGPAFHYDGVLHYTSDEVITTHPRAGQRAHIAVPAASGVIHKIVEEIGDLPAQVEQEVRTLEGLQAENLKLKRELNARPVQIQMPETRVEVQVVEKPVLNGELPRLEAAIEELSETGNQLSTFGEQLVTMGNQIVTVSGRVVSAAQDVTRAITKFQQQPRTVIPAIPRAMPKGSLPIAPPSIEIVTGEGLIASQQRILDVLAQLEALGVDMPHKSNVAVFAGVSSKSGGYKNNLGRLRTLGYISYPRENLVTLTPTGRGLAHPVESIRSLADLHNSWFAQLSRSQVNILTCLIEVYPNAIDKNQLAEKIGQSPTSGGYKNNLGALRSLGIIEYPDAGQVVATSLLFPAGLQ